MEAAALPLATRRQAGSGRRTVLLQGTEAAAESPLAIQARRTHLLSMVGKVTSVPPANGDRVLLEADFADAWRVDGLKPDQDAPSIAARLFARAPRWISPLMALRNRLVAPFGLRTSAGEADDKRSFPVVEAQPNRVVMGFDDRHLDFRLVIDIGVGDDNSQLAATATTYVRTHNLGGRLYLAAVRPFHRIIVPLMLRNAVAT